MQFRKRSEPSGKTSEKPGIRKRAPGAGRPKGDPSQVKMTQAYISLSLAEKEAYEEAARGSQLTLSYYLRMRLGLPLDGAIKRAEL